MSRLRMVFCGTPQFAVPSLQHLLQQPDFEVIGVFTQPDRPKGRGQEIAFSAVKEVALAAKLPLHQPAKVRAPEVEEQLRALAPDVIVIIAYGQIIPARLLAISEIRLDQSARFPAPKIPGRRAHQLGHRAGRDTYREYDHAH